MIRSIRKAMPLNADGTPDLTALFARSTAEFDSFRMDAGDDEDDDDQDDDDSKDDDEDDDDQDDDDSKKKKDKGEDDDEDPKLGAAGQKALEAIKARDKKNRALVRQQRAEIESLKATNGKKNKDGKDAQDDQPDADQIREEARREADAAILSTRIADKIEAKAGARFDLDPEDVAALVLRRNSVEDFLDENNKIDVEAISDALDQLLKDRPGLGLKDGKRFKGGADGGRRKDTKAKPKSLDEAITSRLSSSHR